MVKGSNKCSKSFTGGIPWASQLQSLKQAFYREMLSNADMVRLFASQTDVWRDLAMLKYDISLEGKWVDLEFKLIAFYINSH